MLIQNLALYEPGACIRVNRENDPLFYFFDYDARAADENMQFQHFHTFYELCVLLSPSATHFLEGKPYELETFDIVGIPPSVLHMTRYPEGDPSRRLIVQFSLPRGGDGLTGQVHQLLEVFRQEVPIFRFDPEIRARLYRRLNDIFLLTSSREPLRDLTLHLKFMDFLTLLYRHQGENRYANTARRSPMEQKLYDVASYIHAHYPEPLSLESLSQRFYISSCYLSHRFREVTGFTVTDYIQMTRVRNVQAVLLRGDTPITEAALGCGFTSFSQFNRVFRKHIGMTPSEYRRRYQVPGAETGPA